MRCLLPILLVSLIAIPANAQEVTPDSSFQVVGPESVVADSGLLISLDEGRDLLGRLDSLEQALSRSERQNRYKDTLINNLESQVELCERSRAQKDTLLKYGQGVRQTQDEVIQALRENESGFFEDLFAHTQSFSVGFAGGATTCALVTN